MRPINRWNLDKRCDLVSPTKVEWTAVTTGGFGGFQAVLEKRSTGVLRFTTPHVSGELAVADLGLEDRVFEAGGSAGSCGYSACPMPTRIAERESPAASAGIRRVTRPSGRRSSSRTATPPGGSRRST